MKFFKGKGIGKIYKAVSIKKDPGTREDKVKLEQGTEEDGNKKTKVNYAMGED